MGKRRERESYFYAGGACNTRALLEASIEMSFSLGRSVTDELTGLFDNRE